MGGAAGGRSAMKIANLHIENFRALRSLDIDFTDALGRVRPVTVIAGPNASGKTSILEALDASVGQAQELYTTRPNLNVVRRGAVQCSVSGELRFSEDEIRAAREVIHLAHPSGGSTPEAPEVRFKWTYPDPQRKHVGGRLEWEPGGAWRLPKARVTVARLLATGAVDRSWFNRCGRLFIAEQERTGLRVTIPRDVARLLLMAVDDGEPEARGTQDLRTQDLHTEDLKRVVCALAVRDRLDTDSRVASRVDYFAQVRDDFARLAPPHRIVGVVPTDDGVDVRFSDGKSEYGFDDLSSGQRMFLRYIVALRVEHIHRSIVAIDEVELHQHPAWQARLVHSLPGIGEDNQYILTTHSEYVRRLVSPRDLVNLGSPTAPVAEGSSAR